MKKGFLCLSVIDFVVFGFVCSFVKDLLVLFHYRQGLLLVLFLPMELKHIFWEVT